MVISKEENSCLLTLMIQFRYGSMYLATTEKSFTELPFDLVNERTNACTHDGMRKGTDGRTNER